MKTAACVALVALFGCASTPPPPPDLPAQAVDFFPVSLGSAWSYWVTDLRLPGQGRVLLTSRIATVDAKTVTIDTVRQTVRYEILPDGIYKPEAGYHVLKTPLQAGAEWPIPSGGLVRIDSERNTLEVPAGTIEDCLFVVEEIEGLQRGELHYCRGVGLAKMKYFDLTRPEAPLAIHGELNSYVVE